jgi:hypothetical protein
MDKSELDLWRMCDIHGFAARKAALGTQVDTLNDLAFGVVRLKDSTKEILIEEIESGYNWIYDKYGSIDISLLDERFPVESIKNVQDKYLSLFNHDFGKLCEYGASGDNVEISLLVPRCRVDLSYLADVAKIIMEHPGYREYRKITDSEPRTAK